MIWLVNPGKRKRKAKSKKRRGAERTGRVSFRRADGTTVTFGGGKFRKNPSKKTSKKSSKKHGNSSRRKSTSVAKGATKKESSMAERSKKKTAAQRRAIALKNLAKARAARKGGKKSAARKGSKSKARRSHRIEAVHKAGARLAHYRWHKNPVSGIFGAVKSVAPLAASFYIGRFAATKVSSIPGIGPAIGKLGNHTAPVASIALLVAGHFATKKISGLQKYAGPIMQGFALNFINTALATYAPETVRKAIGVGDAGIYDEALGMGEYVNQAGYETIDGYETVGDMQDMADYADLADAREALVPSRSTVEQIGPWSPEEATEAGGIFAHNGWGGY